MMTRQLHPAAPAGRVTHRLGVNIDSDAGIRPVERQTQYRIQRPARLAMHAHLVRSRELDEVGSRGLSRPRALPWQFILRTALRELPENTHRDLQLRALRVELWLVRRMDGKKLVAQEVLPRLEGRGDRGRPAAVVRDELALRPLAVREAAGKQSRLFNLELQWGPEYQHRRVVICRNRCMPSSTRRGSQSCRRRCSLPCTP